MSYRGAPLSFNVSRTLFDPHPLFYERWMAAVVEVTNRSKDNK